MQRKAEREEHQQSELEKKTTKRQTRIEIYEEEEWKNEWIQKQKTLLHDDEEDN